MTVMKILAIFFMLTSPLFGLENKDDLFNLNSSKEETWQKEWNGDPWTTSVQGNDQTLIHAKTVWEWANNKSYHSVDRNAREAFGELFDKLPFNSSVYPPPFKLKLYNYLKIDGCYIFIYPLPPTDTNTTPSESPLYAWVIMDTEGHVLWAFHWYYSSSYEFPWIMAIHNHRYELHIRRPSGKIIADDVDPYDQYYNRKWDRRPIALRIRDKDRVVYLLDSKTGTPRQLYVYSKKACALAVYSQGIGIGYGQYPVKIDTMDWDFGAWQQYTHQTPEELERLERILGKFIDIQMNPESNPASFRQEIEKILPKARQLAKAYHAEQAKRREHIRAVYGQCSKLIRGILPEFKKDQLSRLTPFRQDDIQAFLQALNLPLNRFYPDAYIDAKFQILYCTERWIKKIWKGNIDIYNEEDWCRKRSFRCTLIPENTGRSVRIACSIAEYATENLCREGLADRWFWKPFAPDEESGDSVENVLRRTRINPGLVGEYDLASILRMNYRGVIIPESETSSIVFRRGNTVVALISSDPHYSVLPLAKKIDQALKKIYTLRS